VFLNVLGYSVLAGVATIAGTLLILHRYEWARHNSIHLMSFAAGIMLALAFLHLIPEAIHVVHEDEQHLEEAEHEDEAHREEAERNSEGKLTFILVLLGFIIFYAIESFIMIHPRHDVEAEGPHKHGTLSVVSITGLTFHSVIDGIIIAAGFKAGFQIGIMTTIAVILHETPEGIVTTSILLHDAMEKAKVFWFSLLVAVATPVGAVVSYFILGEASGNVLRALLALAAGSFIYIAAADLIPETHREERRFNTVVLIIGMAVLYLIGRLLGH
jgi:ZIP family zinc transporter/zinc and cadmium transporter